MPEMLIRSVFDQYSDLENCLTNALIQLLASDQRLARQFVRFVTPKLQLPPTRTGLSFACQRLPGDRRSAGELTPGREEAVAQGLPDGWIYWDETALLIESKVKLKLTQSQLERHLARAGKKGFQRVRTLVITAQESDPDWLGASSGVDHRRWRDVYGFVSRFLSDPPNGRNELSRYLAAQFLQYIRDIEARRKPGENFILSTFQGIPFDEDKAFEPREARQVLRQLMPELRKRLAKSRVLDVAATPPKLRLTGAWDVVPFSSSESGQFTDHPHLSVGISGDGTGIAVILPNGAQREYWKNLEEAGATGLSDCLLDVLRSFDPLRRTVDYDPEPRIMFQLLQRHVHARYYEVHDGLVRFDLDSLKEGGTSKVKPHPGWIPATMAILGESRNVNLQVEVYASYPFSTKSIGQKPAFVEELVRAAEALKPFLDLLRGEREASPSS